MRQMMADYGDLKLSNCSMEDKVHYKNMIRKGLKPEVKKEKKE